MQYTINSRKHGPQHFWTHAGWWSENNYGYVYLGDSQIFWRSGNAVTTNNDFDTFKRTCKKYWRRKLELEREYGL